MFRESVLEFTSTMVLIMVVVVVVVVSHIQRIGCQPEKKTTLHGGQSRSWSAEQGKKIKQEKLNFKEKIRTRLDLLSIPQSGGKNVKTFRWGHRLQIQNLFMAFKRVPLW